MVATHTTTTHSVPSLAYTESETFALIIGVLDRHLSATDAASKRLMG